MKEIKIENDNIIDKIIEFICKYFNVSITIKEITKSEIIEQNFELKNKKR